uniref:Putative secreted protein n=1 Tax=Rhipicephalus microplus TaxID=6941 RepID=A0A6M2DEJ3_RHIMP
MVRIPENDFFLLLLTSVFTALHMVTLKQISPGNFYNSVKSLDSGFNSYSVRISCKFEAHVFIIVQYICTS